MNSSKGMRCAGATGGFAVVDFHDTLVGPFRRWMGVNHVKMEGHLLPELKACFAPVLDEKHFALGGCGGICCLSGKRSLYQPDNGLLCAGQTVNPPVLEKDAVRFPEPVMGVPQSFQEAGQSQFHFNGHDRPALRHDAFF